MRLKSYPRGTDLVRVNRAPGHLGMYEAGNTRRLGYVSLGLGCLTVLGLISSAPTPGAWSEFKFGASTAFAVLTLAVGIALTRASVVILRNTNADRAYWERGRTRWRPVILKGTITGAAISLVALIVSVTERAWSISGLAAGLAAGTTFVALAVATAKPF